MAPVTITVRNFDGQWCVFDANGGVTAYQWRAVAVVVAYKLLEDQPGMITVVDAHGQALETIDLRMPLLSRR